MQYQTPATLKRWIAGMMASNDYKISEAACELLLDKTGASMEQYEEKEPTSIAEQFLNR